ncbi:hypothetical protein SH139x_002130 [Planctomycetaceae bacterium SH139]
MRRIPISAVGTNDRRSGPRTGTTLLYEGRDPRHDPAKARGGGVAQQRASGQSQLGDVDDPAFWKLAEGARCCRRGEVRAKEGGVMIREAIIRKIVERDVAGDSLIEDDVSREHELLHAAANEDFGSWDTALEYSGVRARDVARSRDLTAERTVQQLRRLCTTGYDLGASVNRRRNRELYDAALHHHGTWRAALSAAGINLANVSRRRPEHFNRKAMALWLRNRQAASQSLVYTEVCLEHRDKALAIRREFGSWQRAVDEACNLS